MFAMKSARRKNIAVLAISISHSITGNRRYSMTRFTLNRALAALMLFCSILPHF
jgi:hypothetical protein